jgi:hypothetical protein
MTRPLPGGTSALLAALLTASCGAARLKLPEGPAVPAADAAALLERATATCGAVRTLTAEVAVRGSVGGRRIRARLIAGLEAPGSAYLEAPAPFGAPIFIFAARDSEATLLLARDRRVLQHADSAAVLQAIAGVPLDPSALRATLTGCAGRAASDQGVQVGADWRIVPGREERFLRRDRAGSSWRLVAVVHHRGDEAEWRVEYRDFLNDLPRSIRLISADRRGFDLQLVLSQVDVNVPLGPDTFVVRLPPAVAPVTLDELREAGPLSERPSDRNGR